MAKVPMYQKIANQYRDRIISGQMPAGARLPTRRELAAQHGTSRATADKVMETLMSDGLAVSTPRSGMSVADLSDRATGMDDRMASLRATGKALAVGEDSRIIKAEMVACPPDISRYLGVDEGVQVLIRERVTSRGGVPVAISRSFYTRQVAALAPELARPVSIPSGSRELAAERMGSRQSEAVQYVTSRMSSCEEMDLLDLGELGMPVPVTQVARVVTVADGRVVEAAIKVTEGSRPVMFRSELKAR